MTSPRLAGDVRRYVMKVPRDLIKLNRDSLWVSWLSVVEAYMRLMGGRAGTSLTL